MSVSDDSKVKLIETKYEILYSICKQIKDKEFEKLIHLSEMKHKNPIIYELLEKYDKNETKCDINVQQIHKQIIHLIKSKCISILQLITGNDIKDDQQIDEKLMSALNKLSLELSEVQKLDKRLNDNFEKYQSLFMEYLELGIKYYKQYKIPFKVVYDEMFSNLLMSKAQTLCIRNRLDETDSVLQKYGKQQTIQALKQERKSLELEEFELKSQLKRAQTLLSQYESLDPELLKEYKRLKNELDCRRWAVNELNQSSGSTSNGSINISD